MADIILNKPEAGTQAVFEAAGDSRIDLNFPTDQATLERSGNDLIFRFDDGSTVVLRDFYTAYTKDSMPDFVIEGTPIAGEQFFTALNEPDLMPAAGPAANAASADGGRFREYADDALINGVNRLDGLDLSSNRAFFPERDPWGGLRGDDTPNYAPTLSVSGSLGVIESGVFPGGNELYEGVPSMSGRATGTDANGDTLSFGFIDANGAQVTSIVTPYGVMAMAPDGTYTYTIDNADPDTNGLALGETRTETFTVYVSDGRGGLATQEITVTLTGTNDRPELSIANAAQGIHEDTASVGGTFAVQDPDSDSGQNQTFHIEGGSNTPAADGTSPSDGSHSATGSTDATFTTDYGKLTLDPATGQWTYALNNASDKVQQLNAGETKVETFEVTVTDEHGATSTQTITVTITGTNDIPVIDTDQSNFHLDFKEQGVYQPSENGDGNTPTTPGGTGEGQHQTGTLSGRIFASDADKENGAGSTEHDVNKLNFHVEHAGSSLTDGGASTTVTGTGTPGTGDIVYAYTSAYGTLTFRADGSYEYTLNNKNPGEAGADSNAVNNLALGQTVTETFTVYVTDAQTGRSVPQTITVTINGTNDRPELSIDNATQGIHEDSASVGGTFTVQDPDSDSGQNQTFHIEGGKTTDADGSIHDTIIADGTSPSDGSHSATGSTDATFTTDYGKLTLAPATGQWTYALNNASDKVQQLNAGETKVETFEVTVTDEHGATSTQTISVTITGTNDIPVIDTDQSNFHLDFKEQGVYQPSENGDGNTPTTPGGTGEGQHQTGTLSGRIFASDADKENGAGSTEHDVNKLNFHVEHAGSSLTDGGASTTVTGTGTPGTGDVVYAYTSAYGTLTFRADGSYEYTLNNKNPGEAGADGNAVNNLALGQTVTETFTVYVTDAQTGRSVPQTITVTINGTNDVPTLDLSNDNLNDLLGGDGNLHVVEDGVGRDDANTPTTDPGKENTSFTGHTTDTGTASGNDVDAGHILYFGAAAGENTKTFDPSVFNTADSTATGGAASSVVAGGQYGNLTINSNGSYTYAMKGEGENVSFELDGKTYTSLEQLAEGDTIYETFTIYVRDEHNAWTAKTVTVAIHGTNDIPTLDITGSDWNITQGGDLSIGGTFTVTDNDRDAGTAQAFHIAGGKDTSGTGTDGAHGTDGDTNATFTTDYGKLILDPATGQWTYEANPDAIKGLGKDETKIETFEVTVTDEHGATSTQTITVTLNGINDLPVIDTDKSLLNLDFKEQGVYQPSENGDGNTPTTPGGTGEGQHQTGTLSGRIFASDADKENGAGSTEHDVNKLNFHVEHAGSSLTDGGASTTVTGTGTPGTGDIVYAYTSAYGTLTFRADGSYEYTLNNKNPGEAGADSNAVNNLALGQTVTETFTVYVTDAQTGRSVPQTITVTINGTNDRPELSIDNATQGIHEDSASVGGTFTVQDPDSDSGQNQTFHIEGGKTTDADGSIHDTIIADGTSPSDGSHSATGSTDATFTTDYGKLTLAPATGQWTYALNNASDKVQQLNAGETKVETFEVTVTDEHGATSTQTISVTITGTNDIPVIDTDQSNFHLDFKEQGVYQPSENGDGNTPTTPGGTGEGQHQTGTLSGRIFASDADKENGAGSTEHDVNKLNFHVEHAGSSLTDGGASTTVTGTGTPGTGDVVYAYTSAYGTLTFRADGSYEYTLNNKNPGEAGADGNAVNNLALGQTVTETFTVYVTDAQTGRSVPQTITVTINGTNDVPTLDLSNDNLNDLLGGDGNLHVVEDGVGRDDANTPTTDPGKENTSFTGHTTDTGTASGNDVDAGHILYFGAAAGENTKTFDPSVFNTADSTATGGAASSVVAGGQYGNLTINSNGSYTYAMKGEGENVSFELDGKTYTSLEQLAEGDTIYETFTIYVRDEHNAWTAKTVTVAIHGTNDIPTLDITGSDWNITQGGDLSIGGTFTVTDNDRDAGTAQAFHIAGGKDTSGTGTDGAHGTDGDTNATFTTDYGKLILDPATGQWTYEANPDAIKGLGKDETKIETFEVTVTDEHGATSTQTITVTLNGINDLPVIDTDKSLLNLDFKEQGVYQPSENGDGNTPTTPGGTGEGQHQTGTLSGRIFASDADKENGAGSTEHDVNKLNFHVEHAGSSLTDGGASTTVTGTGTPGTGDVVYAYTSAYGTLTFRADGSYEYTLNNKNPGEAGADGNAVNNLALGQTVTETFTVYVTDAQTGRSVPQTITVTINGTNDVPTLDLSNDNLNDLLGGDGNLHVVEDGVGRDDANTPTTDPGKENTSFTGHTTDTGTASGNDVDAGHILYFGAAAGENTKTFDPSVFNTADSTATGGAASSVVAGGQYGNLTINSNGSYTYAMKGEGENVSFELDGKTYTSLEQLAEGDTIYETFTIYVRDEHNAWTAKTVTVAIHGTNDIPTLDITGSDWNITQGGDLSIGGTFTVTDNDRDAGTAQAFHIAGGKDTSGTGTDGAHGTDGDTNATFTTDYGKLILDPATGQWTYEANPDAIKGLGKDETKIETFEVTVTDEHGATSTQTITVTLNGINDAPWLGQTSIVLKEEGVILTPEQPGETSNTETHEAPGNTGEAGQDEHRTLVEGELPWKDDDINDKPIFGISGLIGATDGILNVTIKNGDPDASNNVDVKILSSTTDPNTHIQTIVTNYGTLTLDTQTGKFTFDISGSDADKLAAGEELEFSFHTTVNDQNGGNADNRLDVTIRGTNDRPTLDLVEPTHGDNVTVVTDDKTGEVKFDITEKADVANDTTVSGTLKSDDDDRGANLRYGVALGKQDVESEAGRNLAFGSGSDGKPGMGEPLHQVGGNIVIEGRYGTLTIDPESNTYTYKTNENADRLGLDADGNPQTGTDEFTIYVRDEHGAWTAKPISVTVTGSNDTPTITADDAEHWVKEAGVVDTSTDHGTTTDTAKTPDPSDDSRELTDADNSLSRNEISGQVHVKDTDTTDTLTLDIGAKEGSGTTLIGDPKTDANGNITLETEFGSIILHKDGTYTYTIDEDKTQSLAQGQTEKEIFTITVSDGHGGTASVDITINIVGTNDRPTLTLTPTSDTVVSDPGYDKDHNEVAEDTTVTGTFRGTDPDSNPTLEYGVSTSAGNRDTAFDANGNNPGMGGGHHSATGTYGSLTIDPSTGEYTYTLDTAKNGAADKLGLNADGTPQTGTDTFTIYVRDEHGAWSEQTVTITVNGSNDKPVIANTGDTLTITESGVDANNKDIPGTKSDSGKVDASDVDTGDTLTYFFSNTIEQGTVIGSLTLANGTKTNITVTSIGPNGEIVTDYGTFHLDTKTGEYTFTKAESTGNATDQLQLGDKVELDFSISVKDSHGETASSTHDVTVVINGSNDRPSATMQGITVKEAGVHDGNTATTADTDGTLGAGEHRVTSGTLNITNLKDVDDDISKGFGTGEDQFKISLRGSGNCGTPSHNADGTWTMTHLLSNGGDFNNVRATLFNSNFPKDAFDKLEAQLRAEGLLGQNQDLHLRQRGFHPLSGGAQHPDRQPGRFILLYPATGRLGGQHDREHVRRGQLLQPDHQLLSHRPARRRFQRFIRRHHQGHQRPARTGAARRR